MPIRKRTSKRRYDPDNDPERATILAGLRGDGCPPGGNRFMHLDAEFATRGSPAWTRVVAVFSSLSRWERREIIRARRARRLEADNAA